MFNNSYVHIRHGIIDVIITIRTAPLIDKMRSVNVFVLKVEKSLNLSCLPKDDENVFKPVKLFSLEIKILLSRSFFVAVRELDENPFTLFKKETRNQVAIFG